MDATQRFSAARFSEIEDDRMSKAQWGIVLISGMGFFTDAYDLFVIGVVLKLLKSEWHVGSLETALVGATALVSAAIGSAVFGRVADVFGRKYIYAPPRFRPTSGGWWRFDSFSGSASGAIIR